MASSTTLSIATAELMEGAPAVGWWLGGAPWRILALAVSLGFVSLGAAIVFTSLDGAVLNDRVQRRLLRNVFIQNTLIAISLMIYFARDVVLVGWLAGAWLFETAQGTNGTLADAVGISGGMTFRQQCDAWLIGLLRGWNLIGPVLPLFLFVAHELRRPLLLTEQRYRLIARQARVIVLSLVLLMLSTFCIIPMVDISVAATAHTPGGAIEIFYDRMDQLGLLNKSDPNHRPRFNHQGPVWSWPPDSLANTSVEAPNFDATLRRYRRRGHSPEALTTTLDYLYNHERQRRQAAAKALDKWHSRFPPASPQSYSPPPGEPWTWTMLPLNYTDPSTMDTGTVNFSAFPLSRVWRPQQTFLVEEPVGANYAGALQTWEEEIMVPGSFSIDGSGCDSCNGEYVLDGEYDGVPQYSYGEGDDKVVLLRYAMPTGTRYWYISLASDLHSGNGDIYRAKSSCKQRSCVDMPPEEGWTDTCTLQGQKCTEKLLDEYRWRIGGLRVPTVKALGDQSAHNVNQSAQRNVRAAPFQLVVHVYGKDGDTVLVSPGVHTAGVSLTEHLTIRGACATGASTEKFCEPGHPPAVLVGSGCTGAAGMLRWWIRRTALPRLLSIGELLGALQRHTGHFGYSPQECAAVWVTSPAAILADLTIVSTQAAWEATAWNDDQDTSYLTEAVNMARPTNGPFYPVALEISAGSSAVVAHCVIVGGVVVRGARTSPLLEFLTIKHATTGLQVSNHASPTVIDVKFKHVETGIEAMRWAMPTLSRVHIVSAKQTGVLFATESSGALSMSAIVASGTCNLAVTSGASPVVTDSFFRLAAQSGVVFDGSAKGTMRRCHISESHYAGLEIRGTITDPDIAQSSVHGGAAVGLYVHSGGSGTLTDVTLLDNQNGASEFADGGRSRLLRCQLGGHAAQTAVVLDVHGAHSTPEFVDCDIDATAVHESVAVRVSDGAGPVLRGAHVHGAEVGVLALGSVTPRLLGCSVHDNKFGVELVGAGGSSFLDRSSIYDNQRSIVGSDNGYAKVHNCELSAPGVAGLGTHLVDGASISVE